MINNFALIIGSMKCGTTSLFKYLSEHPQIAGCKIKEPNFFADDENWSRGFDWYQRLWEFDRRIHSVAIEASTHYTKIPKFPNAAERIAETKANFKFIYIMRNPIERIESHYTHAKAKDWTLTDNEIVYRKLHSHVIEISQYARQLEEYYKHFSHDDILLLNLKDLKDDPHEVTTKVFRFLGVDSSYKPQSLSMIKNANKGRLVEHELWKRLKGIEMLKIAFELLPVNHRKLIRNKFIYEIKDNIRLSKDQRSFVLEELHEDLKKLLDYGFDISSWDIEI